MKIDAIARLERHAKRLGEIAAVLGKYGLADLFGGFDYPWLNDRLKSADGQALAGITTAARVRLALTELGTTTIKLGQMLSTRADLIGAELTAELTELQANVPAEPLGIKRARRWKRAWGIPWQNFLRNSKRPVGSGLDRGSVWRAPAQW